MYKGGLGELPISACLGLLPTAPGTRCARERVRDGMAQQGTLALFLLLILLPQGLPQTCSANDDPRVTDLLIRMLQSFNPADTPNASILLALRLARQHNLPIEHAMVQRLKEDAVHRVQNNLDFSSGLVALYVMALQASCENPQVVCASNATINLVQLLEDKYAQELSNINAHGRPLTNYFQIGLDIMALCMQNVDVNVDDALRVSGPDQQFGSGVAHFTDTEAVLALGLTCVNNRMASHPKGKSVPVRNAVKNLVQRILAAKQANGVIGNIYSTGLAMQALFVTQDYYPPSSWSCLQTLSAMLDAISKGEFNNPMAASQLTPSLQGLTYLNARGLNCAADQDNLPIPTPSPPTTAAPNRPNIRVSYTVIDSVSHSFDNSIVVDVPEESTYLTVMEVAQNLNPQEFSFKTQPSSWGPYLVSVNGLEASNAARTFWQLQNGSIPLMQGVGDYKPSAGEHLVSNFTTY